VEEVGQGQAKARLHVLCPQLRRFARCWRDAGLCEPNALEDHGDFYRLKPRSSERCLQGSRHRFVIAPFLCKRMERPGVRSLQRLWHVGPERLLSRFQLMTPDLKLLRGALESLLEARVLLSPN
jgi:hypothetical protein